jgi:hypothetical protein
VYAVLGALFLGSLSFIAVTDQLATSHGVWVAVGMPGAVFFAIVSYGAVLGRPSRRRRAVAVAAPLCLVTALGITVYGFTLHPTPAAVAGAQPSTTSLPLIVTHTWPQNRGCDTNAVAMPDGKPDITGFRSATDVRDVMISSGAGAWQYGALYVRMSLSSRTATPVEILNLKPHIVTYTVPVAWIWRALIGCGPDGDRSFTLNLDRSTLRDNGFNAAYDPSPPVSVPREPIGPTFRVTGAHDTLIRVDALSCTGNYQWTLDIEYAPVGDSAVHHALLGPFLSFGLGRSSVFYSGTQDQTGALRVTRQRTITGTDPSPAGRCRG